MAKTTEQKIQELELQTVKVVTELQKDVQALTTQLTRLTEQIQKMAENYVTKVEHLTDVSDLKVELNSAKKVGLIRTVLVGVFMTALTAFVTFEVMRITR